MDVDEADDSSSPRSGCAAANEAADASALVDLPFLAAAGTADEASVARLAMSAVREGDGVRVGVVGADWDWLDDAKELEGDVDVDEIEASDNSVPGKRAACEVKASCDC